MENLKRADFYYDLPEELIAQHPAVPRDTSRMMVIRDGETTHSNFYSIAEFLREGDLLVLNNSKVFPARLYGRKRGTEVDAEFLLLKQSEQYIPSDSNLPEPPQLHRNFTSTWEVMVRPGRRLKAGSAVDFPKGLSAEIKEVTDGGNRIVQFILPAMKSSANFFELLEEIGEMPLPPYITEKLQDKKSYNTIYSTMTGSAAAPTAGLHFTERIFSSLAEKGVNTAFVTLHVGLGTFRPVKAENVADHKMHSETYVLPPETAKKINETKKRGGRVIAVGTTSCRVLESVFKKYNKVTATTGDTDIFIYPPYRFNVTDGLLTNFHLPESSLLMLVSALTGKDNALSAYKTAVKEKYRFFSFGDCMLIL